jgi:hypothetical protein
MTDKENFLLQALQRAVKTAMKWYSDSYEGTAHHNPREYYETSDDFFAVRLAFGAYGLTFEHVMSENLPI